MRLIKRGLRSGTAPVKRESQMQQVLSDPNMQRDVPRGIKGYLALLFRSTVIAVRANSLSAFNVLLVQYINNPNNGIPNNVKDRVSARGNLTKELFRDKMTWVVFCKAMRFLQIRKMRINLEVVMANGSAEVIEGKWLNLNNTHANEFVENETDND